MVHGVLEDLGHIGVLVVAQRGTTQAGEQYMRQKDQTVVTGLEPDLVDGRARQNLQQQFGSTLWAPSRGAGLAVEKRVVRRISPSAFSFQVSQRSGLPAN